MKTKIETVENINESTRKTQKKKIFLVLGCVTLLAIIGWIFTHAKSSKGTVDNNNVQNEDVKLSGVTSIQFSKESSQKALEKQQREIRDLHDEFKNIGEQVEVLQKILDEVKINDNSKLSQQLSQEMLARIDGIENILSKKYGDLSNVDSFDKGNAGGDPVRGISTVNFLYKDVKSLSGLRTAKDYVPPGTFAKAVLLNGADTNAGVHGQTDTTPIVMRILDNGTLPNGKKSSLKGCFVTAAAYGDASSERGQIRLQRLSCVRKPSGQILDIPVEGTINDMGGSDGIRGHVIMRNSKLIWNAGVSGILSGFGSAMQKTLTSQSISPFGVTNVIKSGKSALQYGAFGGANTALGKLADYYIKLADMYHPIVQIHAGSEVNIVFLRGFSLTDGIDIEDPAFRVGKAGGIDRTDGVGRVEDLNRVIVAQDELPQDLMRTIRDAQLGQEFDYKNSNVGEEIR